jgi:hypothetical protein
LYGFSGFPPNLILLKLQSKKEKYKLKKGEQKWNIKEELLLFGVYSSPIFIFTDVRLSHIHLRPASTANSREWREKFNNVELKIYSFLSSALL